MQPTQLQKLWPILIFTALYLAIATTFAIGNGNWEFAFYISVVIILSLIVLGVHRKIHLTNGVLWCLSVWGLLHMLGGLMPIPWGLPFHGEKAVFYSLWIIPGHLKYDHIVHAFGFGISTWICWQAMRTMLRDPKPTFGVLALCALGGMGLGAMNEIVEFIAVLAIPDTNVGGYINTGWDLVANAFGATIAACIIWFFGQKEPEPVSRFGFVGRGLKNLFGR